MMSREYPCVYYDNEKCRKNPPEDGYVDWCVMGPCSHETPSNADRIRAMSDEELADFLHNVVRKFMCEYCKEYERIKNAKGHANCNGECDKAYLEWLKQPAEEEA